MDLVIELWWLCGIVIFGFDFKVVLVFVGVYVEGF